MNFLNRFSQSTDPQKLVAELTAGLDAKFRLGFIFISGFGPGIVNQIVRQVRAELSIKTLVGSSGYGVISSENEIEGVPAASLFLAEEDPGVMISSFYFTQDDYAEIKTNDAWYELLDIYPNEKPQFILFNDPDEADIGQFVGGLSRAYPGSVIVGGLASQTKPDYDNVLIHNGKTFPSGIAGVALMGNVIVDGGVSQGCRPIGETFIITKSEQNIIYELAGRQFYEVLEDVIKKARSRDRKLAQDALYVGIAMDEYKYHMAYGDFLVRALVGVDENSGAGVIADFIHQGQTIQFHVRDPIKADEDLNTMFKARRDKRENQLPTGALVFSCSARGEDMFGRKGHDLAVLKKYFGEIPVAGFFTAGEIGPVTGKNYIHGISTSVALFYQGKR